MLQTNANGQLGDGTMTERHTPVQVHNLTGITAIAASEWTGLALKNDGTVWAWGVNYAGQLGDGTTTERHLPVRVVNFAGTPFGAVTAIAASVDFSLAIQVVLPAVALPPILTVEKLLAHSSSLYDHQL